MCLQHYALFLSEYQYKMEHEHSRAFKCWCGQLSPVSIELTSRTDTSDVFNISQIGTLPVTCAMLKKAARNYPVLVKIYEATLKESQYILSLKWECKPIPSQANPITSHSWWVPNANHLNSHPTLCLHYKLWVWFPGLRPHTAVAGVVAWVVAKPGRVQIHLKLVGMYPAWLSYTSNARATTATLLFILTLARWELRRICLHEQGNHTPSW